MKINYNYFESERVKIVYICNCTFDKVASVLYARRRRDSKHFYITAKKVIANLTRNLKNSN